MPQPPKPPSLGGIVALAIIGLLAALVLLFLPGTAYGVVTPHAMVDIHYVPPEPAPEPEPEPPPPAIPDVWAAIADCESHGDPTINTGNGYYGLVQFSKRSWDWMGGQEFAEYPHQATAAEQIVVAERLLEVQGWGAWPACSRKLGLRP